MWPKENQISEVRVLLMTAFDAGLARPPESVVDCEFLEDDDERAAIHTDFLGKSWWKLDYATLFRHRDSIPLFHNIGFAYYTPAYLLACLELMRPEAYDLCSNVLMSLNPVGENGEIVQFTYARLNQFTEVQRKAIARFISMFLHLEALVGKEARLAFSAFWEKYS